MIKFIHHLEKRQIIPNPKTPRPRINTFLYQRPKPKKDKVKPTENNRALQQANDPSQSLCYTSGENCLPIDTNGITRCPDGIFEKS